MSNLEDVSRLDVDWSRMAKAAERMRRLEQEAHMAFSQYHEAREALDTAGMTVDIALSPGMAAAYSAFKQDLAVTKGQEAVKEIGGWSVRTDA